MEPSNIDEATIYKLYIRGPKNKLIYKKKVKGAI